MDLSIEKAERLSRSQLLLRTFFGPLYIVAPHAVLLFFFGIWANIAHFVAFWSIMFTGRYPEQFFEFQVKLLRWQTRLHACTYNLIDGYPAFGLNASHPSVHLRVEYPERLSRGTLILRAALGWLYVGIPHGVCLALRSVATSFLLVLSWWSILITGTIPLSWFSFNVGTLRWLTRMSLYLTNMTDTYPPFSGKP